MDPHNKEDAKKLREDFIPNGEPISIKELSFRRTFKFEVYRCCERTSYDLQSGPIYCGGVAEWVAEITDDKGNIVSMVALCGKRGHMPLPNTIR